ncbi:hypothetical protein BDR26DRAFT_859912 [Obelidium mucronatum]|nr:hypothetical protein BDR26DRAFT_859912 [Obelidium mucronatum]
MAETASPHFIKLDVSLEYITALLQTQFSSAVAVSFNEIPTGWNNKAIKVSTTIHKHPLLLRLSSTRSWPRKKIESEANTLSYLATLPELKTPTLIAHGFDFNYKDCDSVHWMLSDFIPAEMLESVWRGLETSDKLNILNQLRDVLRCLRNQVFHQIGGVALVGGIPQVVEYWRGYKYDSEADFFVGKMQSALLHLRSIDIKSVATKQAFEEVLESVEQANLADLIRQVFDKHKLTDNIVLCHNDFAFRNIMVRKNTDSYDVVAILDWEWCGAFPDYNEYQNEWLEEENEDDRNENKWIRSELERDKFPAFSNFGGLSVRGAVKALCIESLEAWRFEDESSPEFLDNIENIRSCLHIVEGFK